MNVHDFLAALAQTPRDWELHGGLIRRREPGCCVQCPITAVAGGPLKTTEFLSAAKTLGLRRGDAERIAAAADELGRYPRLRPQLLAACSRHDRDRRGDAVAHRRRGTRLLVLVVTQRQRLRAAKIALAGRLLWHESQLRKEFGHRAINDILNTLLRQAKFPRGAKVPDDAATAIEIVTGKPCADTQK
jgi:hypothetical protein